MNKKDDDFSNSEEMTRFLETLGSDRTTTKIEPSAIIDENVEEIKKEYEQAKEKIPKPAETGLRHISMELEKQRKITNPLEKFSTTQLKNELRRRKKERN